jgi:hypothetical protein
MQNLNTNRVIASWLGHQRLRHHGDAMDIWWFLIMFNHPLRLYFNKKYSTRKNQFEA